MKTMMMAGEPFHEVSDEVAEKIMALIEADKKDKKKVFELVEISDVQIGYRGGGMHPIFIGLTAPCSADDEVDCDHEILDVQNAKALIVALKSAIDHVESYSGSKT